MKPFEDRPAEKDKPDRRSGGRQQRGQKAGKTCRDHGAQGGDHEIDADIGRGLGPVDDIVRRQRGIPRTARQEPEPGQMVGVVDQRWHADDQKRDENCQTAAYEDDPVRPSRPSCSPGPPIGTRTDGRGPRAGCANEWLPSRAGESGDEMDGARDRARKQEDTGAAVFHSGLQSIRLSRHIARPSEKPGETV
jgi:hypothetical protein